MRMTTMCESTSSNDGFTFHAQAKVVVWVLRERRKGLPIAGFAEEQDPVLAETLTVHCLLTFYLLTYTVLVTKKS